MRISDWSSDVCSSDLLAGVARGWDDELRALAGGECQRNHGVGIGDALPGVALVHDCRAELAGPLEGQAGNVDAIPPVPPLQVNLARTVDADLGDVRRRPVPKDAEHPVLVVQEVVGNSCYGSVFGVHALSALRLPAPVYSRYHT